MSKWSPETLFVLWHHCKWPPGWLKLIKSTKTDNMCSSLSWKFGEPSNAVFCHFRFCHEYRVLGQNSGKPVHPTEKSTYTFSVQNFVLQMLTEPEFWFSSSISSFFLSEWKNVSRKKVTSRNRPPAPLKKKKTWKVALLASQVGPRDHFM
jgi:hypothetical protein